MSYRSAPIVHAATKPLTSLLLILFVYLFASQQQKRYRLLCIVAFIFCLIGDIALLFERTFLLGLAAFLCAHLLFLRGFIQLNGWCWHAKIALFISVSVLAYAQYIFHHVHGPMSVAVGLYISVIGLSAYQAIACYQKNPTYINRYNAIAMGIFLLSDSLLGLRIFVRSFSFDEEIVLIFYWISLTIIAIGSTQRFTQHTNLSPQPNG